MLPRNRTKSFASVSRMIFAMFVLMGVTCLFALHAACAEEQIVLEVDCTVQPEELIAPGDVELSFTVTNISSADAVNVCLSSPDGLISELIGLIPAGETSSFTRIHSVSAEELENGSISYVISHDAALNSDETTDYVVNAAISRSIPQPEAEFTRRISNTSVSEENTVTVIYGVKNTGNVGLHSLCVQDTLGDFVGRIDRLEVGESRSLISKVVVSEDTFSSASLSYNADMMGEGAFEDHLTERRIALSDAHIDAELSAGYTAFKNDTADVVLVLTNTGNVDYRNIKVTDDINGGLIADNVSVPANADPVEISCAYPVRGESGFRWRICGMNDAGDRIDFVTDTVVLAERETSAISSMSLQAECETPRIRKSGDVKINVHIENTGESDVRDAVLSEETLGEIRSFVIVTAGGSIDRTVTVHPEKDTQYNFSLRYTDAEGWIRELDADAVSVTFDPNGVLPEGAKTGLIEFTGTSVKLGGSKLYGALLLSGVVVLVLLVIILAIATRKARMEKQIRIAAARIRRNKNGARTAKPKSERTAKNDR